LASSRRDNECNELPASRLFASASHDIARKERVALDGGRQWPHQIDAGRNDDFTDLIESDFDVTAGDGFKTFRTLLERRPSSDSFPRNTEAFEQPYQVDTDRRSRGRIVVSDRSCGAQGPFKSFDRTYVGLLRAFAYKNANPHFANIGPR
jgi:hypothetical protein